MRLKATLLILVLLGACLLVPEPIFAFFTMVPGSTGYDISYPQCTHSFPEVVDKGSIIGVNGGKAFMENPCLLQEYAWAKPLSNTVMLYMNLNYPSGLSESLGLLGPLSACEVHDLSCQAFTYGYNAANFSYTYASTQIVFSSVWWLDIELANTWADDTRLNRKVLDGAMRFLSQKGIIVGIYSTKSNWNAIMGEGYVPWQGAFTSVPQWVVGSEDSISVYCISPFFKPGIVWMVQYSRGEFDGDYSCP